MVLPAAHAGGWHGLGMIDSSYLEHAELLDVEDCHHHVCCLAAQGLEYLPRETDFACFSLFHRADCHGALQQGTVVWGSLAGSVPLGHIASLRAHQPCSRHKLSPAQVGFTEQNCQEPEGRAFSPVLNSQGADLRADPRGSPSLLSPCGTWSPGMSRPREWLETGRRHAI